MKDARKRDVDDRMNVVWEWKVMAKENLWSGLNQVRQREQDQTVRLEWAKERCKA